MGRQVKPRQGLPLARSARGGLTGRGTQWWIETGRTKLEDEGQAGRRWEKGSGVPHEISQTICGMYQSDNAPARPAPERNNKSKTRSLAQLLEGQSPTCAPANSRFPPSPPWKPPH